MAADHIFELDAPILELATELDNAPDNSAASIMGGFVIAVDGEAVRFEPPDGLEGVLVVPGERVETAQARAALAPDVSRADAVFNVAHASILTLGLATGDLELVSRGLEDRLHQQARSHLYPKSIEILGAAREAGALGATISGAGPTVLAWTSYETTGSVVDRLSEMAEGWATVQRVGFDPAGADVSEL
jgi:homoserine kinase